MRIKHIYITKEGEPMANPNEEYSQLMGMKLYEDALNRWRSGLLPFEDKKDALDFIPWEYHGYNGTILSQHWNTLIPVELEVEVVEVCQIACQSPCDSYNDTGHCKNPKIFLRIKP